MKLSVLMIKGFNPRFLFCVSVFILICFLGCNSIPHKEQEEKNEPQQTKQPVNIEIIDSLLVLNPNLDIDSLLQGYALLPDTNTVMLFHQIGEKFEDSDFAKAKKYYEKMGELCEQIDWNYGRYQFTINYSHLLIREGIIDSAILLSKKALDLAVEEKDDYWVSRMEYSLGNAYLLKQWFETALEHYMKALEYFEKNNDYERMGSVYSQLSQLYTDINVTDKAIEFGEKSVVYNPECPYSLTSLAQVFSSINQFKKANEHLEKALHLCTQQDNIYLAGVVYYHIANNFFNLYDFNKTEKYAQRALEINEEIGNAIAYVGALTLLGKLEKIKGNILRAEQFVKDALQISIETNNFEGQNNCYIILAELAIVQQKYKENVQYWKSWEDVNKEIASEITLRTVAEMEAKYESSKKEIEISKQKTIIEKQRIQHSLYVGGVVLCVIIIAFLWYLLYSRIRRNRVLAEMNATKDKFFSIISHDLKNPALAQRGALQMLFENAELWDVNTIKKYCQNLLKSADGQVELLYNLLNWAQIQTGRMPFQPIPFDLIAELRKTTIPLLVNMASRKDIELNAEVPNSALLTGDANMITTVVRNLLDNAIKFTPKGGTVTLKIAHCTGVARDVSTMRISVTDTGIGMEKEQIENLLRHNRNSSKRGTAGERGTGLGLMVCKELLEKHGTTLQIESNINEGTTFWFEI